MIHIYCGDGKGKTTAAVGMAVRIAAYGKKVLFVQFLKGAPTGETEVLKKSGAITVLRCDRDYGFFNNMTDEDKKNISQIHNENLSYAENNMDSFDMIIFDEIFPAYRYNLLNKETVMNIADNYKGELIMTGREPQQCFAEKADYISEIKKIKHPFDKGIGAREGIEF